MRKLRTSREITAVRSVPGGGLLRTAIRLTVDSTREGALAIRFATPSQSLEGLEQAAISMRTELAARLPAALRPHLTAEVGAVRSTVSRDDAESEMDSRHYAMASWRGVVLGIGEPDTASFSTPWSSTVEVEQIDPELPVVLAPSAVLTLVSFALEVSGSHTETEGLTRPSGLMVTDTASSPYPPQHYLFGGDGAIVPDRPLLEDGEWCNREESVGGGVDPIFFLLTRPERALRPLAASSHFVRRNLAIRCSEEAALDSSSVLSVDSWKVRVGPRSGVVPFDAEVSLIDSQGARLAGTVPLRLDFDPWRVLQRIRGACGPELPAVDEDPIEGDAYGLAPSLAMDLTVSELLGSGSP